jgi:hypothetical protein
VTADPGPAPGGQRNQPESGDLHISLTVGSTAHRATLRDTPAGRDFAALLPLSLTLRDFAGTEKISDLPSRLSTAEAPAGAAADGGDIAFYAPWGNLAIFYRPSGYAQGLIVFGRLETGMDHLAAATGDVPVTIAVAS